MKADHVEESQFAAAGLPAPDESLVEKISIERQDHSDTELEQEHRADERPCHEEKL
jgi:hypothetical protein